MSDIDARLASLGIAIPHPAGAPAGAYVPAVMSGNLVFTAGQLPFIEGRLSTVGKVGADVTPEAARDYAPARSMLSRR